MSTAFKVTTLVLSSAVVCCSSTVAQPRFKTVIRSDRTLARPTKVDAGRQVSQGLITITGGTRRGKNLFHSFERFSIPEGKTASFNSVAPKVRHVFARVTGDSVSRINGTIELLTPSGRISKANVILLNPNGIRFGSGASLTPLRGSFIASTAHKLSFSDGVDLLTISTSQNPSLSSALPQALMTGAAPGKIRLANIGLTQNFNTELSVVPRQSLIFVGGHVELSNSRLGLTDARIEIASLARNQKVDLDLRGTPRLEHLDPLKFSNINLENNSQILIDSNGLTSNTGIYLSGNRLQLRDSSSLRSDTAPGAQIGLPIDIQAKDLQVLDSSFIYSNNISDRVGAPISIKAEDIRIDCRLVRSNCAIVISDSLGTASAGKIDIMATRLKLLNGGEIFSTSTNAGSPGMIDVVSDNIRIDGGFLINRGLQNEDWRASGILTQNRNITVNEEAGVDLISVQANRLEIRDGGAISTTTFNASRAGNLLVKANQIDIAGNALDQDGHLVQGTLNLPDLPFSSGLFTSVDPGAFGNGGTLNVQAKTLNIRDGGKLQAATFGRGDAGLINVQADVVSVSGQDIEGQFPSTIFAGSGGIPGLVGGNDRATGAGNDINLTARTLLVSEGGAIAVGSLNRNAAVSQGAGNLNISAETIALNNGGQLISNTASGDGGNISLTGYRNADSLRNLFLLNSSQISSTAGLENAGGDGGDIQIDAESIFANFDPRLNADGSDITANAFNGSGGNIRINAELLFGLQPGVAQFGNQTNDIDASSALGTPGTININAELVDPAQALVELPASPRIPQIARQCDRQIASAPSRLIDSGKGGSTKPPTATAQVNNTWEDLRLVPVSRQRAHALGGRSASRDRLAPPSIVEAQGFIRSHSGKLMLVAQVPQAQTRQSAARPCLTAKSGVR